MVYFKHTFKSIFKILSLSHTYFISTLKFLNYCSYFIFFHPIIYKLHKIYFFINNFALKLIYQINIF